MPLVIEDLDIDDIVANSKTAAADAKFFSSKLTGNGKKVGLLNEALLPVNNVTNTAYMAADHIEVKQGHTQHDITTTTIPFAPITRRAITAVGGASTLPVPHVDDRFTVEISDPLFGYTVFFDMTPQAAVLYEDNSGAKMKRDFIVQYRLELTLVAKSLVAADQVPERARLWSSTMTLGSCDAAVFLEWDSSPLHNAPAVIRELLARYGVSATNLADLDEWMQDYPIYERISRLAQCWDSDLVADEILAYIDGIQQNAPTSDQLNALALQLRYLENYNVPLDAYRSINKRLTAVFSADVAASLAKQNLNLLMNHTLDHLEQMKPQLAVPAQPAQPGSVRLPTHLSPQQLEAITTHEPLVMTQAGAGTGKSTTILQRIDYLEQCGVPAKDITVLSFTNAAADNIREKNPKVGSMTIARMINDIYQLNHPTHELSSIDTIINSIDIFFPTSQFGAAFRQRLLEVDQNKTGAYTAMNTFIENHSAEVINVLDTIKQTSLELEIIICYQQIENMAEPPQVQCRHLIIDEVQDNSIFEFIYVLKYITKNNQSLFIVGDASQTLYEFRSANPRALNTLEGSGVFATYKLTTNYRSNQEILEFANVVLGDLETNRFANIQLQANSLAVPTADSFQEKVTVDYREVQRLTTFVTNDLPGIVLNTVIPGYVDACLDRGEQVGFLAYSRREVAVIQEQLERKYPDRHIASLVSEKVFATDIFSKYIKFFWNDVLQVQPSNASFTLAQGIRDNLEKLTKNAANPAVEKAVLTMVSKWWTENTATINAWVVSTQQGIQSHKQFFDDLRDNLLSYEIRHNAVRQSVTNQKNRERKQKNSESKAELVVSTIHGAKGLEFDNVVIVHKDDTRMAQDVKRMFYVAFTRAMNTEYILSYGTVRNAPIKSRYEQIVADLDRSDQKAAKRTAAIAAGLDPDLIDYDEDSDCEDDSTKAAAAAPTAS
jgi:DNA helicase-2/ATP-dependent DNA helicase PcrA